MVNNTEALRPQIEGLVVSVICPVYNAGYYLEECVGSVLSQSYEQIELVLVNDGSTDDSLEVCLDLQERNPDCSIIVIDKENEGVVRAREAGIAVATGELAVFIDADDYYIRNDAIQMIATAYQNERFDVCLFNAYHERFGRRAVNYPWPEGQIDINEVRGVATTFQSRKHVACDIGYAVIKAFRRILFPVYEGDMPPTLFEDTLATMVILDRAESVYLIDEEFYFYRNNAHSAIMGKDIRERIRCCDILFSARDYYFCKWELNVDWHSCLLVSNQELVVAYLEQIVSADSSEVPLILSEFYGTALCRNWLVQEQIPIRFDKQLILALYRSKRLKILPFAIGLRRSFLACIKRLIGKKS